MKTMLKVQWYYLLDKTATAFLGLFAVFVFIAVFAASEATLGMSVLDVDRVRRAFVYRSSSLMAIRLASSVLGIFLGLHGWSRTQRRGCVFFVAGRKDILAFGAAKVAAAAVVVAVFVSVAMLWYGLVGGYLTPYFACSKLDWQLFVDILLEALFFLMAQGLVTTFFDGVFAAIPAFAVLWVLESSVPEGRWLSILFGAIRHARIDETGIATFGDPSRQALVLVVALVITVVVFAWKDVN
jgi:hypothetical protein